MEKLIKKIKVSTSIKLETGLHIGGNKDNVEIGGIDNPVIKLSTKDLTPYIPGSSLKGKIRSLLEQIAGASEVGGGSKKEYNQKANEIKRIIDLFGYANDNKPSKIIFRDSYMKDKWIDKLKENDFLDMPFTESKWENVIHRVYGRAEHPRQMERIPAEVEFDVEIIINVWDNDEDGVQSLSLLKEGVKALELDYLGGSGSRGYGKVKFSEFEIKEIDMSKLLENE
jgi:CRISPR-associated protein Csm3